MLAALEKTGEYRKILQARFETVLQSWQKELRGLLFSQKEFSREIAEKKSRTKSAEIFLLKDASLTRQIEDARQLHASTLQQLIAMQSEESAITRGRNSIEIRVLDAPKVIKDLTWPNPKLLLPASGVVGFLAGLALVGLWTMPANENPISSGQTSTDPAPGN